MKKRDGMSASHLALVRKLPCCVCLSDEGCQAHHLGISEERGIGQKASDQWAVPLCVMCHARLHTFGFTRHPEILLNWGVNGKALARRLWHLSHNKEGGIAPLTRMRATVKQGYRVTA